MPSRGTLFCQWQFQVGISNNATGTISYYGEASLCIACLIRTLKHSAGTKKWLYNTMCYRQFQVDGGEDLKKKKKKKNSTHLHGRWVHELKGQDIIYTHGFQRKQRAGQVGSLNLGDGRRQHFITIRTLRVETIAFAWTSTTGTARALLGLGLTKNKQRTEHKQRYKKQKYKAKWGSHRYQDSG